MSLILRRTVRRADPYAKRGSARRFLVAALILRHGGFVWPIRFLACGEHIEPWFPLQIPIAQPEIHNPQFSRPSLRFGLFDVLTFRLFPFSAFRLREVWVRLALHVFSDVFQPGLCSTRGSIASTCRAIGGSIVPSSALRVADNIAHSYSLSAKSVACPLSPFLPSNSQTPELLSS